MNTNVDVLAVMKLALRHLNGGADSLTGTEHFEAHGGMKEALEAVAELIEVARQFASADFGDTSILDNEELCDRLRAALARVRGAA